MVFYWSRSDSKSPRVSQTLLSILVDLNNAIIWMTSTSPLISNFSSSFTKPFQSFPSAPIIIRITVTFLFHIFLELEHGPITCLSFHFLGFSFCCLPGPQSSQFDRFFYFANNQYFCSSSRDRWSVYILNSLRMLCSLLTGQTLLFFHMVKFKFLAQFPVDHVPHPVVFTLVFFLRSFAEFGY